jgi:predicted permease
MDFARDVRYSLRTLRKTPGFTVTAILSLAIGIGATTAIFALVNGLLLRPLDGVREQERLVNTFMQEGSDPELEGFSLPAYREFRDTNDVFDGFAVYTARSLSLTHNGESRLVASQIVSGNYFSMLGTHPLHGRFFLPEEDATPGTHPVVVVSSALWHRHFGSDPQMVGKQLLLNGLPFTVIGIAPPGFGGTYIGFVYDLWIPTAMTEAVTRRPILEDRGKRWLEGVARLRPGVSLGQAKAALSTISHRMAQEYPQDRNFDIVLRPLTGFDEDLHGGVIAFLIVLTAVSLFVLLIACVNVANMLLARATVRGREVAIRIALGMSRRQLVAQLLTESLVLALLGGTAGLFLAQWGIALLRQLDLPANLPVVFDISLDLRVLSFSLLISVVAGLSFGLVPARQSANPELVPALKDTGTDGGRRTLLRSTFVVVQVALSLLLLVTAGLFLRALQHATSANLGFDPKSVETVSLDPSVLGYDAARAQDLFTRLADRARTLPGAESVALSDSLPLGLGNLFGGNRTAIQVPGVPPPPGQDNFKLEYSIVGSSYFDVLRIPLLNGRPFTTSDTKDVTPVAIVTEAMVKHFWPGQDPIGKTFTQDGKRIQIVGIAKDSKYIRVNESPRDHFYIPYTQSNALHLTLLVRTRGKPAAVAQDLRNEIRNLAQNLPIVNLMTMEESISVSRMPQRIAAMVASILGLVGLLLAAVGIYGVVAYSVAQRRREIGIRIALGAQRSSVLRLVLRQGLKLALFGVLVGGIAAFGLGRLLESLLFGLSASDPVTYLGIAALLMGTALAASLLPARRAARTNPMTSFRIG